MQCKASHLIDCSWSWTSKRTEEIQARPIRRERFDRNRGADENGQDDHFRCVQARYRPTLMKERLQSCCSHRLVFHPAPIAHRVQRKVFDIGTELDEIRFSYV